MNLKSNINKIHSDLLMLKGIGETVTIEEKSSADFGNYVEISATHDGATARVVIEKVDIEGYSFRWRYFSNPKDESVGLVERVSTLDSFAVDLIDVFEKKRFDSEYLSQIKD
jgi:hypothetical protein